MHDMVHGSTRCAKVLAEPGKGAHERGLRCDTERGRLQQKKAACSKEQQSNAKSQKTALKRGAARIKAIATGGKGELEEPATRRGKKQKNRLGMRAQAIWLRAV